MKETLKIFALISFMAVIFLFAISFEDIVFAVNTAEELNVYEVTCEAPKAVGVGQTKELTLYYSMKNFNTSITNKYKTDDNATGGINALKATLEYDHEKFEDIEINVNENTGVYTGIKNYEITDTKPIEALDNWQGAMYNPDPDEEQEGEPGLIVIEAKNYTVSDERFLKVVLKVKPNAEIGDTTVTLKVVESANTEAHMYPKNNGVVAQSVSIVSLCGDPLDSDLANGFGGFVRILPNTTLAEFKLNDKYKELSAFKAFDGTTLKDNEYIPTGAKAEDSNIYYTIITMGDINADGKLSTVDLSQIRALKVGNDILEDASDKWGTGTNDLYGIKDNGTNQKRNRRRAADAKFDGILDTTDIAQCRMASIMLIELGTEWQKSSSGPSEAHCYPVHR